MEEIFVTVVRNNKLVNIDEKNLQKKDIIVLQAGEIVPADIQLIEARELEIDEFEITGELLPVTKEVTGNDVFLFMGSKILKGEGKGVVVATREQTEYGAILNQEKNHFSDFHSKIFNNLNWRSLLLILPALIISLIFSMITIEFLIFFAFYILLFSLFQNNELFKSIFLSRVIKKCSEQKIQIRDRNVFEIFNTIDTICFDKTGVLTTRELEVKRIRFVDRVFDADKQLNIGVEKIDHILKLACALCNDVIFFEKLNAANPIDKALIRFSQKRGMDIQDLLTHSTRIFDKPFNSENRHMAVGYKMNNEDQFYFIKGDPEIILKMCTSYFTSEGMKRNIDPEFWSSSCLNDTTHHQKNETIIALAYSSDFNELNSNRFTFLCMLNIENELRQETREIISQLSRKGIRSILLTGDRTEAALKVGEDCGIIKKAQACLTGKMISKMEFSEISKQSSYCSVFSRLLPSQKGIIIRLLQQRGHSVIMVGDGANDGIALKVADVGISFSRGSSPIARRYAKILISTLSDLLVLFQIAEKYNLSITIFKVFRAIILFISLIITYTSIIHHVIG